MRRRPTRVNATPCREGASIDAWWPMDWHWIEDASQASGDFGACALIRPAGSAGMRVQAHAELVAAMLGCEAARVTMGHDAAGRPLLLQPAQPLHLSRAAREGVAVLCAARCPVGVDIETVETDREPAWNVLSPTEQDWLRALPASAAAQAFAALWSAKEAYLKALGTGLRREPGEFTVLPDGDRFSIDDPRSPGLTCLGFLSSRKWGARHYALAGALLPAG